MTESRIPAYDRSNADGMTIWFSEMSRRGLLFHPEDAPETVIRADDGSRVFTEAECAEVGGILSGMFAEHGDGVIEACYPVFMRAAGQLRALDA